MKTSNTNCGFVTRLRLLTTEYSSVSEFARRCGFHESVIRSYLNDGKSPAMNRLVRIAEVCGVTIDWLATGKGIKYARDLREAKELFDGR